MSAVVKQPGAFGRLAGALMAAHDSITRFTFGLSVLAGAYLTLVLAWEVFARYVLEAPTGWGPDTAGVSFAFMTFLATPMLSWKHGHANMSMVVNSLPPSAARFLQTFIYFLAAAVCGLTTWFGWNELLRVYEGHVMMIAVTPIPKWWLMAAIVYGLFSMGLYFLRHGLCVMCSSGRSATLEKVV